jgi:hypothetical protein
VVATGRLDCPKGGCGQAGGGFSQRINDRSGASNQQVETSQQADEQR